MIAIEIYDPADFLKALDLDASDDGGFTRPEDEKLRPATVARNTEGEVWARSMHKILDDPRGHIRPALCGTEAMAEALVMAVSTMPNFADVTGLIERAIVLSARTRRPVRFPPILMVSPPGVGKTYYCRAIAKAMATTCIPIAINGTSDRGALGGLSQVWRGAKMGKIARGLLIDSITAAPLYLLDELDKPPALIAGENTLDVLLSALEPENARGFVDEYLEVPIALDAALWIASANDLTTIPPPLLSRMLVVEVPMPSRDQARVTVRAIAAATVELPLDEDAVDLLLNMTARKLRQAIEVAYAVAVCAGRASVSANDVRRGVALVSVGMGRRAIGFIAEATP